MTLIKNSMLGKHFKRGQCSVCSKEFALDKDGMVRTHYQLTKRYQFGLGRVCEGVGLPAKEVVT